MVAQHSGHAGVGKRTSDETRTAQRVMMLSSCAATAHAFIDEKTTTEGGPCCVRPTQDSGS